VNHLLANERMTTPSPIKITIELNASDLMPFLIAWLTLRESGGRPASPFSGGFRMPGPFRVRDLDDLLETMGRETDGKGEEPENPFEVFEKVFKTLHDRATEEHARATGATEAGDDTPPDEPQGSEREPEGTAETPEDTRLRFYVQHERED